MLVCEVPQIIFCGIRVVTRILFVPFQIDSGKGLFCFAGNSKGTSCETKGTTCRRCALFFIAVHTKNPVNFVIGRLEEQFCVDEKKKEETVMKALQKASKFLSDYTSVVVIAIAVVTFFVPAMMGWVNNPLFVDPVSNKFTCQSIIIGIIMFSMGLTLTTEDFKILAQRPFDICIGAIAQYLIMPFLAFALTKVLQLPDGIALGLILVGCCPGGVSSNIMSYLCGGDVAFSVGMTTVSTIISPVMTPLMVSLLASGTHITIKGLPMFVSIVETVIVPVAFGFLLNYLFGKKKTFMELQKVMPGVAVLGLACVVGGVVSSQGAKFFESGVVIFVAVFLHNGLGYLLGYGAGRLVGMNTAKKRTISIEVGMQNAGLATNLATTTAQFAVAPESAIICAVSCTWHSISGTLLAGLFAAYDKRKAGKRANKKQAAENVA